MNRWNPKCDCCGGGGVVIGGCVCNPMPSTVIQTTHTAIVTAQSCTYTYGPAPGVLAAQGQGPALWSTASFLDGNGLSFYYYLWCDLTFGYIVSGRTYPVPIQNASYGQQTFFRWLPGFNGNTCRPFHMINGSFPGINTSSNLLELTAP